MVDRLAIKEESSLLNENDEKQDSRALDKENDLLADSLDYSPLIDKPATTSNSIVFFLVAILIMALAAQAGYLGNDKLQEPAIVAAMGALAAVGVFFLIAVALGFVWLTSSRRSDDFSKDLVNGMETGVIVTGSDGGIVYANQAYGNLTGAKSELDVSGIETIFSKYSSASEAIYKLIKKSKSGENASTEVRLPNGLRSNEEGSRWFRVRVRSMHHASDKKGLMVWQLSDITAERHEQETAFQELQHAIHYLDHAPAGFFSSNSDGSIAYLNATLADWLGIDLALFKPGTVKLEEFVSQTGIELLEAVKPENDQPKTSIIDLDFIRDGGTNMPVRLYHKVSPNSDGAPGVSRTLVINRLAKEETDSALLDAELRFTRFFNNTPIAIASISKDCKTVRTNAPFMRMFKEQLGEDRKAEGVELTSLIKESGREELDAALKSALSGISETKSIDVEMEGKSQRHLRFFASPVTDEPDIGKGSNSDERIVVYVLETTEHRAMEEQFAQGQKMQAVGQLAGGIAHDFNNVLTAIIGFSDLLLANHRPSDPSFQDIMNIKQNANRAATLVRQLLAFSRRQTLRPQVLNMSEVMSDLKMLLDRLLGEKVKLNIKNGRDLWPIKADISQLEQVIVNLSVNARDAMHDGGDLVFRTSNIEANEVKGFGYKEMIEADYVLIEVEDQGTGMSEEIIEKMYEPFFSTKEVGKGTGLGLSTVYGIVKQTGGFIYTDSEIGKGTTFKIFLPRHEVKEDEIIETVSEQTKEKSKDLTGNATILLVEDEDAVRAFGSRALIGRGYEVYEASSGVEALEVLEEYSDEIDLIVSDVVMPEMDGPSLYREVRKSHPDLKFIFVSGYAEEAFAKNLPEEDRESFGFLPKPFTLKQLATTVKEILEE